MTATASQILEVRRMVAEPDDTTYDDDTIQDYIERYPHMDEQGELPYTLSTDTPPEQEANDNWIATYDLHAAAADIWQEKAAAVSHLYDFSADGGNYSRSKMYEQYMAQCRYHRSRKLAMTMRMHQSPKEPSVDPRTWIGNLPEPND